jgi:hypothetical protein
MRGEWPVVGGMLWQQAMDMEERFEHYANSFEIGVHIFVS